MFLPTIRNMNFFPKFNCRKKNEASLGLHYRFMHGMTLLSHVAMMTTFWMSKTIKANQKEVFFFFFFFFVFMEILHLIDVHY